MAWNCNPKEFIKVYRKLMDWEWYTDVNVTKLFIHCLLRANWKAGVWQGIHYEAGEFITSLPSLSEESGLSVRQIRTALEKLTTTGELSSRTTDNVTGKKLTKNRIITVNNWDKHQTSDRQNDRQNDKQNVNGHVLQNDSQTDRQATGKRQQIKNNKNNKNTKKKEEKEKPAAPLLPSEEPIDLWGEDE